MSWAPILLYVCGAVACLAAGGGLLYALVQLGLTLRTVRQRVLPQVAVTLTTVQKNLDQVELVTRDLDKTISGAHSIVEGVHDAGLAASQAVSSGLTTVQHRALAPLGRQANVLAAGAKSAWAHWRAERARKRALAIRPEEALAEDEPVMTIG